MTDATGHRIAASVEPQVRDLQEGSIHTITSIIEPLPNPPDIPALRPLKPRGVQREHEGRARWRDTTSPHISNDSREILTLPPWPSKRAR
jgi:hypothetical protein